MVKTTEVSRTIFVCYKSIGNPALNTLLRCFGTEKQGREYVTRLNNGKWHGKYSQASPYFYDKIMLYER